MGISNISVEKDFENKLLKRREILVTFEFDSATPSREELKRGLADKFNAKQENTVIVRERQLFGGKGGSALVHVYQDKEAMKIAQVHTLNRPNKKKGAAAPQPAAAAPAEAPKKGEEKAKEAETEKPKEAEKPKEKEEKKPAEEAKQ